MKKKKKLITIGIILACAILICGVIYAGIKTDWFGIAKNGSSAFNNTELVQML